MAAEWGTKVRLCIRIGVFGFAAAYLSEDRGVTPTGLDGGRNPFLTAFMQTGGIRSDSIIASLLKCWPRTESPADGIILLSPVVSRPHAKRYLLSP
jgi:hypothetical protein